jgi:hypothetical protein
MTASMSKCLIFQVKYPHYPQTLRVFKRSFEILHPSKDLKMTANLNGLAATYVSRLPAPGGAKKAKFAERTPNNACMAHLSTWLKALRIAEKVRVHDLRKIGPSSRAGA